MEAVERLSALSINFALIFIVLPFNWPCVSVPLVSVALANVAIVATSTKMSACFAVVAQSAAVIR